jgi:serine/threonine-protein kinase HipA
VSVNQARKDMHDILENKGKKYSIDELMNIISSASPVGGARPKLLVCYNKEDKSITYNNDKLQDGYVRAIIKFDEAYPNEDLIDESIGLTKLEYLFMSMAKECDIETPYFELIEKDGLNHFIIERFDRDTLDNKFHICSASGLLHKDISVAKVMSYEELFKLTNIVCNNQENVKELYRRMVFNVFAINVDDHAKNFSFIMDKDGAWSLTKAYDITYSKGFVSEHLSTINGISHNFTLEDLLKIAKENMISEKDAIEIIDKIQNKLTKFSERADLLGIDAKTALDCWAEIEKQINLVDLTKVIERDVVGDFLDEMELEKAKINREKVDDLKPV